MTFAMSQAERDEFLAAVHVGVVSVTESAGRGPLTIPVWYSYQPGGLISVITDRSSRKARAISAAGRFSLCAQDEAPPFRYVTVEGPAVTEDIDLDERLAMARRYLGEEGGDQFVAANPDTGGESVAIRMTPEHWLTADFSKQG